MPDWTELDRFPDATIVVDAGGRVVAANDRAATVLGVGGDAVGRDLAEAVDLRDDSGAPFAPFDPPPGGDGDEVHHLTVPAGDDRAGVDVALRRAADGSVVLTARPAAARATAESELVAALAHDLRSPLTSVKGFSRTLLRRWERFSDEQKRTMIATIEADADRVARLLRTLVEVARIDAGRVALRRAPVDVVELARTVVDQATASGRVAGRRVTVDAVAEPVPISGDEDKLEQVLFHLVDNALTYAPDGPVTITITRDQDEVRIQVADEGPGVRPDDADALFGRLVRGPDESRPGIGLGLYLVRGIIEAHGGEVWFDPDVAGGATVHVRLPAGDA